MKHILFGSVLLLAAGRPAFGAADIDGVMPLVTETYISIHQHPELGLKEFKTAALIRAELEKIGFTHFEAVAGLETAVIAVLDTGRPGPVTALRSELDARPTQEVESNSPRSQIDGVMHNCGHDAHAAMLLGAAAKLWSEREQLTGKIVFVFQPAEETKGGADDIVADGILKRLGVTAMFAQHVYPSLPVGKVSFTPGPAMAGSNYFSVKVKGRSSHAADPSGGDDVPQAAARIVQALGQIPARKVDIVDRPLVISITHIETGGSNALNVLPREAVIEGTIRAFEDVETGPVDGGTPLQELILRELKGVEIATGVNCEWTLKKASPPTINNRELQAEILPRLRAAMPGIVSTDGTRGMFSEDFSYYTSEVPCLYFGLGVTKAGYGATGVHTAAFNLHPDALKIGTRLLVELAQTCNLP